MSDTVKTFWDTDRDTTATNQAEFAPHVGNRVIDTDNALTTLIATLETDLTFYGRDWDHGIYVRDITDRLKVIRAELDASIAKRIAGDCRCYSCRYPLGDTK